jgi:hypothetical protein
MQGIYTYIPETNHVHNQYNVAAILSLLFMVAMSLVLLLLLLLLLLLCSYRESKHDSSLGHSLRSDSGSAVEKCELIQ